MYLYMPASRSAATISNLNSLPLSLGQWTWAGIDMKEDCMTLDWTLSYLLTERPERKVFRRKFPSHPYKENIWRTVSLLQQSIQYSITVCFNLLGLPTCTWIWTEYRLWFEMCLMRDPIFWMNTVRCLWCLCIASLYIFLMFLEILIFTGKIDNGIYDVHSELMFYFCLLDLVKIKGSRGAHPKMFKSGAEPKSI